MQSEEKMETRKIDAHNHPDWHGHDLGKFLANMDENGIEKCFLLTFLAPEEESDPLALGAVHGALLGEKSVLSFSRSLSYMERAPERFILGYAPDPRDREACRKLIAARKIYGARLCGEIKFRTMYDSPDCLRLFHTAGELGMPVTLHMQYDLQKRYTDAWGEWWGGSIHTLEHCLQECPETVFLGHAPGFWIHISGDDLWKTKTYPATTDPVLPGGEIPRLLRTYPNLYCDISSGSGYEALTRDRQFTKKFLLEFQDRVLFARDYFDHIHEDLIESLDLPESVKEKIYFGNARKLVPPEQPA